MILKELIVRLKAEGAGDVKRQVDDLNRALNSFSANQRRAFQQMTQFQQRFAGGGAPAGGMVGSMIGNPVQISQTTQAVKGLNASLVDLYTAYKVSGSGPKTSVDSLFKSLTDKSRKIDDFKTQLIDLSALDTKDEDILKAIDGTNNLLNIRQKYYKNEIEFIKLYRRNKDFTLLDFIKGRFPGAIEETILKLETSAGILQDLGGKVMPIVSAAFKTASVATIGYVAALGKLGGSSIQAAIAQQDLETRLLALTGSSSKVDEMKQLFLDIAGPSAFTMDQIAEAGTSLQAYGVNVKRTLPLIAILGQAFGASNEQLQMYVGFIGRLKGGYLDETLGRLGITKADLSAEGIQFDKGGSLQSSAEQTMVAIEKIVKQKYSRIFSLTSANASTMAATITDSFTRIEKQGGKVLLSTMTPFMKSFGKVAQAIANSGVAKSIYENLFRPFTIVMKAIGDTPTEIAKSLIEIIIVFEEFSKKISKAIAIISKLAVLQTKGTKYYGTGVEDGKLVKKPLTFLGIPISLPNKETDAAFAAIEAAEKKGNVPPEVRRKELTKSILGSLAKVKDKPFPSGGNDNFFDRDTNTQDVKTRAEKNTRNIEKIANNTKKSADLLELRRQTIGGGAIASLGLTGAEITKLGFKIKSDISIKGPIRPATGMERAMRDLIRSEGYSASTGMIPIR